MKAIYHSLAVLALLVFSFAPGLVRAQDDSGDQGTSFQTFYDQLGDQGTWVQTDDYGYVFQPNVTDPNWAPYTDGHWVNTDAGWTWVSDEPWGWATYHYGRWANIDGTGWVWVPGYRWAPAWVSWRYGGGYCGWAPLPPETFVGAEFGGPGADIGIGFHFGGDVDVNFHIGPGCYNFVRVEDIGEPNYRGRFIDRNNNYGIINHTTNITNINVNKTVVNNYYGNGARANNFRGVAAGGPNINEVNAHARTHVQTVSLTSAGKPGKSTLQGNSLAIFAPRVNPATMHEGKPGAVAQTIAHPTLNRGDSITKPLAVTASIKPQAPSADQIHSAEQAQANIPAHAKIATEKTPMKTTLHQPLSSLRPLAPLEKPAHTGASAVNGSNGEKPVSPSAEHPAASAPFTGETEKPAVKPPPTEEKPASTYHPETEVKPPTQEKPAETYHPPSQGNSGQTYHPAPAPPAQTYHPASEPPAQAYHPQSQGNGGQTYHPAPAPPAQTYHPQSQGNGGGGGAAVHPQAPPANHPPPSNPQGGNKPPTGAQGQGNKNNGNNQGQN